MRAGGPLSAQAGGGGTRPFNDVLFRAVILGATGATRLGAANYHARCASAADSVPV